MKVSKDFGIVIRRQAIDQKSADLLPIMSEFHFERYFDESNEFISLGLFFGGDNADACVKSLEKQGLVYIDDFFILDGYFPDWCGVEIFAVPFNSP